MYKKIITLVGLLFPLSLMAQHGSGGAGLGDGIGYMMTVLVPVAIVALIVLLITIVTTFKPNRTWSIIGMVLSLFLFLFFGSLLLDEKGATIRFQLTFFMVITLLFLINFYQRKDLTGK